MELSKGTKKIGREIEAAAVALGFPRQVSCARVERELARYCPKRYGTAELDCIADRPRFRAVAALWRLMEAVQNLDRRIASLRREVIEESERTRELVGEFVAKNAAWKALSPQQRSAEVNAEMKRRAAARLRKLAKVAA